MSDIITAATEFWSAIDWDVYVPVFVGITVGAVWKQAWAALVGSVKWLYDSVMDPIETVVSAIRAARRQRKKEKAVSDMVKRGCTSGYHARAKERKDCFSHIRYSTEEVAAVMKILATPPPAMVEFKTEDGTKLGESDRIPDDHGTQEIVDSFFEKNCIPPQSMAAKASPSAALFRQFSNGLITYDEYDAGLKKLERAPDTAKRITKRVVIASRGAVILKDKGIELNSLYDDWGLRYTIQSKADGGFTRVVNPLDRPVTLTYKYDPEEDSNG